MRKLIIMTGAALGALSIGSLATSGAVSAAGNHSTAARSAHHPLPAGEDGDDGDDGDEEEGGVVRSSGGSSAESSGGGSGSGSLAATGIDASSMALLGALTLAVGGATYRVALRRNQQR
jgi:hypothetical protein